MKEVGALYQAHLAQHLRDRLSAAVSLDPETGMARLDAIPDPVRTHFSKRTLGGEEAARAYAKELGLDWDTLAPERRAGLLKAGTQGTAPGLDGTLREKLRKDDMADFADWRRQADGLGWRYAGIETHGPPMPPLSPEERLQKAYEVALPWLEKELDRRAVIGVGEVRAAALRGLIAHGIEKTADVDAVTERFMAQGVMQHGQYDAALLAGSRGAEAGQADHGAACLAGAGVHRAWRKRPPPTEATHSAATRPGRPYSNRGSRSRASRPRPSTGSAKAGGSG